ncbi:AlkA N-terminal domain-containing protein [Nocardioides sp. CFH 31398]|uniref:AlkA N-terminal domain-containing protein n=1 Tax=Nocardioides sp. CFH 31398 TaxID=2919579 RepID=UPI001F0627EA|nr:AlkA N-terminal domain-containing protein [Nocardioides sp. CFH 31398]MCH1867357.1 helix-turn-helix domain-containing protein [Nocardioides sp. CFH 31398]
MSTAPAATRDLDPEACYRAAASRDRRFDGVFWVGVTTTGIYCRPSCPARTPAPANMTFHRSAAAAQTAGFRACKRCLPDAVPGDPEWDLAGDVAGRAMRLIADGVVDREGVEGLADRLGFTPRHLGRLLGDRLGAGPLALARARRAQTARTLLETTDLALADVAFAAGFASVRQFNDTVRAVYDATPGELRRRRASATGAASPGEVRLRVPVRTPYAGLAVWRFLAAHVVAGVETATDGPGGAVYARTLRLPHGPGTLRVRLADLPGPGVGHLEAWVRLSDVRDLPAATARTRRLLDADADPLAADATLGADPVLGPLVARQPGLRVPGQVDGAETALRTVVGQQVSLAGARTVLGRLVAEHGEEVPTDEPGLTHLFPTPAALAAVDPETLPMPRARGRALVGLATALADGSLDLDGGTARGEVRAALVALPGIGPWTADYVAIRALGDPDVFLPGDLAVRNALRDLGHPCDAKQAAAIAEAWSPWRSVALLHLWHTVVDPLFPPVSTSERPEEDPCGP